MSSHMSSEAGRGRFEPRAVALRRWQRDWESWSVGPEAAAGLRRWSGDPLLVEHCGSVVALLAACGRDRSVAVPVADGRLAALIAFARAGDRAAARVVLERVMPALTAQAATKARRARGATHLGPAGETAGFGEVLAELVGAAWLVICSFPLDRRPRKIAVNVVLDAVYRVFGYRPRIERATVYRELLPDTPVELDGRPAVGAFRGRGASAELLDVLAEGVAGGVDPAQLRLLADLALVGLTQAQVAARGGISDRAVRLRRNAAVRALRAALLPEPSCLDVVVRETDSGSGAS
ncbi:conserved hypothetical protein [Frankia canadensis]|uniref:Uncharacterized protein n=1 Tax=Frankia canadensis TaxID=1836972 RepID=A0A2I2KSV5_9ACTN|nr:conserved hypothetical protein [Frankia canadensis]SOU56009.1 conserved hypothetical protein [Frankia canadensis]